MNKYLIKFRRGVDGVLENAYVFAETHSKAYIEFATTHGEGCIVSCVRRVKKVEGVEK